MNKKGMLLASEVLKIVLAVISILFLIYLLFSIYYASVNGQKKEQAQSTIDRINDIVVRIGKGAVLSERITDVTPVSWNFFSFVGQEKKPNLCVEENCLCICDEVNYDNILWFIDRQLTECDGEGVCLIINNLNKFEDFEIEGVSDGGTNIEISKSGETIEVKRV